MAKRRGGVGREEWEAADALEGRRAVDVRRLIELIRAVNPTGQELPAADAQRRYTLKSRLQSLLVRRFGDELTRQNVRQPTKPRPAADPAEAQVVAQFGGTVAP